LAGIARSADEFEKSITKMRTSVRFSPLQFSYVQLYYKQQKFNLMREESEGYAKLAVELGMVSGDVSVDSLLGSIRALIGYFEVR
jgi:hypothetical protein